MSRRGVALILVLLLLVVAVTAAAGTARLAIAARSHAQLADQSRLAGSICRATDAHILEFLRFRAARVVLPPDSPHPSLILFEDEPTLPGGPVRVRITAFDQCGMVPWGEAHRGSPLRDALSPAVARVRDTRQSRTSQPGLDELAAAAREVGLTAFPESGPLPKPAIGAQLATHNPDPAGSPSGVPLRGGLINVNTAPEPLLAAALLAAQASGLDEIIDARSRGELAQAPPTPPPTPGSSPPASSTWSVRLVSQSDAWAFRIDVETQAVRRSWWCVYRATGTQWRCVQRVAISE